MSKDRKVYQAEVRLKRGDLEYFYGQRSLKKEIFNDISSASTQIEIGSGKIPALAIIEIINTLTFGLVDIMKIRREARRSVNLVRKSRGQRVYRGIIL